MDTTPFPPPSALASRRSARPRSPPAAATGAPRAPISNSAARRWDRLDGQDRRRAAVATAATAARQEPSKRRSPASSQDVDALGDDRNCRASIATRRRRHSRYPSETYAVFALARDVSVATDGAFDITVAPVVDAWGFGPGRGSASSTRCEIGCAGRARGLADPDARYRDAGAATKARPDVRADLSGIAKGYGVDRAAQALDALGIGDYMIEAGGEVRTRGHNANGRPWQIAIERPDAVPQRAHLIVPLSGLAMATSGDYRIYFEHDGRRYCHEIDPATGRPIAQRARVGDAWCARNARMRTRWPPH